MSDGIYSNNPKPRTPEQVVKDCEEGFAYLKAQPPFSKPQFQQIVPSQKGTNDKD